MEFKKPFNKDYLNPVDKYLRLQTVLHSVHLYDHSSCECLHVTVVKNRKWSSRGSILEHDGF